jgi:hypothetical protein
MGVVDLGIGAIGLILGVIGTYIAYLALPTKRRVEIFTGQPIPLLPESAVRSSGLRMSDDKTSTDGPYPIENPYITRISVVNTGQTDVTEAEFASPIRIWLNTPYFKVMSVTPRDVSDDCRFKETCIEFGPALIKQGELIGILVLTNGEPSVEVSVRLAHVINNVHSGSVDRYLEDLVSKKNVMRRALVLVVLILASVVIGLLFGHYLRI